MPERESVQITITLDKITFSMLCAMAKRLGRSRSSLINELVQPGLCQKAESLSKFNVWLKTASYEEVSEMETENVGTEEEESA